MNILISIVTIGALYGFYDFFIKLSAGRIDSTIGALVCQLFSVLTIIFLFIYRRYVLKNYLIKINWQGFMFVATAGILIGLALVSLFFFFTNKNEKAITAFPVITSLRNITLIFLGIIILKENFTFVKAIGFLFSLIGVYFLLL